MVTTRCVTFIFECTYKIILCIIIIAYGHWEEFLLDDKTHLFISRMTIIVPGVCPCIRIGAVMQPSTQEWLW